MLTRRHFVISLSGSAAIAAVGLPAASAVAAATQMPAKPAPLPAKINPPGSPTVHVTAQDAANIAWAVSSLCSGWVEYGETDQLGRVARGAVLGRSPIESDVIQIPITGLTPGQTIHYRTVTAPLAMPNNYALKAGEAVVSPLHTFSVPSPQAERFKLAVWNDTHEQGKTLDALRKATAAYGPDLLMLNGDLVRGNFHSEEGLGNVFLRGGSGVGAGPWPVVLARGNHEGYGPLANRLPRFAAPQHPEGYYQLLRLGPVALLVLDTGTDKEDDAEILHGTGAYAPYRQLQKEWLAQAVTDPRFTSAPFRILCCHIPLRWEHPAEKDCWCANGDQLWSPLLAAGKVQAVVSGHTHRFWHSAPTAQRPYHQVIGGGPELRSTGWSPTPATLTEITAENGTLRLRVAEVESGKEHLNLTLDALPQAHAVGVPA